MSALAALPHCSVKLSGFGMFDTAWTPHSIQPLIDDMLDLFGTERMMWGSNFPVDKLMLGYDTVIEQIIDCAKRTGLADTALDQLFRTNAAEFYRL